MTLVGFLPTNNARRTCLGMLVGALIIFNAPVIACNYGKYGLEPGDSSQATVDGLFRGEYTKLKDYKTDEWRREAADMSENATDIPGKLNYAWALHMSGADEKAFPIYQGILKSAPDHYETLCSYATVLHSARQYQQARKTLQKAVSLKPGFRNRAEEFHLAKIDYEEKSQRNYQYAKDHLFVDELTSLWKKRGGVEENFSTVEFPQGYTSEGMAELLRQYPLDGEAWLALGMLLEHEEDFSMAAKAYDRALKTGTAHAPELRDYMKTFREFGRANAPGRTVGRGILRLIIVLAAGSILYVLFRFSAGIISDITGVRARKAEEKRRERRRNKDPDAPL